MPPPPVQIDGQHHGKETAEQLPYLVIRKAM
jgi:hypothetical protein